MRKSLPRASRRARSLGWISLLGLAALLVPRALAEAPPGHFVVDDDVVSDTQTGLTWQVTPIQNTLSWNAANSACEGLSLGGFDDWRLPTLLELHSIIDSASVGPVLLDPAFLEGNVYTYWSMTRDPHFPNHFAVDVRFDSVTSEVDAGSSMAIARCVR